jgi:phospholipid/cholesterol/gamma-HCH transport system permease protein
MRKFYPCSKSLIIFIRLEFKYRINILSQYYRLGVHIKATLNLLTQCKENPKIEAIGSWTKDSLGDVVAQLKIFKTITHQNVLWDFEKCTHLDSAGALLIIDVIYSLLQQKSSTTIINLKDEHKRLLIFYRKNFTLKQDTKVSFTFLAEVGKAAIHFRDGFKHYLNFIGRMFAAIFYSIVHPNSIRFVALIKHIDHSGLRALPIISLTSFLVGLVIAYQASDQLSRFGANIFIVEMSAISVFRELAPLITAIVVAGRSASSYTAEIGTMKITEEVDAMGTMGFNAQNFLVLPRIYALMISMPLIVFFADMIGLFGGMLVAKYNLDINFTEFISRMYAEVHIKHLYIGLIKAPIYGLIIASIGCFRGFQVTGSTESIGHYTTVSVVNAIFWVIAANAVISVLLTKIGV